MNPQAEELNKLIEEKNQAVSNVLSEKGKAIFFPKKGILAQTADAKGKKINATIGAALEEDGSPMRLKAIADKVSLNPKDVFPYAPSFGKPELRKRWKEMIFQKNPSLVGKNISLPVVTNALTHGISMMGYMFVNPGDKIISPDLYWGNYRLILQNGYEGVIDTFDTFKEGAFNLEGLRQKLDEGTGKKILMLNFPNNPTGYTVTVDEAAAIKDMIKDSADKGNKLVVIVDDAYFGLVYKEGVYMESMFSELADIHENVLAVKIDGATKEDYVWGLRVGFVTYAVKGGDDELYDALASKTAGAIRGNISNDSHLSQSLVLEAFNDSSYADEKKEKYAIMKKRFDTIEGILQEHAEYSEEFTPLPHNSGYFMCIQLQKDAEQVRQVLLEKYSTGVIAIGNILRLAFSAVKTDDIPELLDNVYKACKEV